MKVLLIKFEDIISNIVAKNSAASFSFFSIVPLIFPYVAKSIRESTACLEVYIFFTVNINASAKLSVIVSSSFLSFINVCNSYSIANSFNAGMCAKHCITAFM